MANGYTKAAHESVPGNENNTPTLSTKVIYEPVQSINATLEPKHLERDDELRPGDEPLACSRRCSTPSGSSRPRLPRHARVRADPDARHAVSTAGDGVITDPDAATIPVGATRHVWTAPFGPTGLNPKTVERILAYKDSGVFFKAKGCGTSALSIDTPESGGVSMKASGPALHLAGSRPRAHPDLRGAHRRAVPARELHDRDVAGQHRRDRGRHRRVRAPDGTRPHPRDREQVRRRARDGRRARVICTGSIPKRVIDADDYDALLAGTGFAVKVKWTSTVNIGATSYKYTFWLECLNAQYLDGGPEALANKRRHGGSFNWKSTNTGTAGSTKLTLVNATASYV
jgi:hypothetical protein